MEWLSIILGLIPIVASGIQTLHKDKTLGEKQQMAQDALGLAVQGATVALPADQAAIAQGVGTIAQTTLSQVVSALHNGSTPSPAPVAAATPGQSLVPQSV